VNHPVTLAVKPFGGWVRFTVSGSDPLTLGQSSMGMASQRRYGASLYSLKQSVADHLAHLHYGTIVTSSATETSLIMPPNLAAIRTDSALIKQLSERIVVVVAVTGKETTEPLLASDMQLLTSALKVQGYQAVVVPSGLEAIAAVKQLQPAAIFLVLSTPQPLSWPMCLLLKNSVRQAPMVVVGDVSQQQAAQAGVDHVLSLPLTNGAISQCLSELLGFPTTTMINGRPRWGSEDAQNTLVKPLSPIQPPAKLTVLHLETASQRTQSTRITALSQRLNLHGCRVIAIESFEEAELLIPIWKPRIILYTSPDAAPLQRLVQNSPLFELPFVITHPQVATQARQLRDLVVYECPQSPEADLAALVTVIQIAADKTSTIDRSPRL
jgi:CheY-like chemotaxis protein